MIRKATTNDVINLTALSIQVWLHTYATEGIRTEISNYVIKTFTETYFANLLNHPNYQILVFIKKNHLVGYITVNLESCWMDKCNGYEIETLYVQEHFQGKGIGRQLLSAIQTQYGRVFWLKAWVNNKNAIGFYTHFGFMDIGHTYFELDKELHENRVLVFNKN